MDPSINTNSVTAEAGTSRRYFPGIQRNLSNPSWMLDTLRVFVTPLGIDVDKVLENREAAKKAAMEAEDEEDEGARLYCPLCEGPYILPMAIKACGHVFCSSCIEKAMNEKGKKCPTCGARTKKNHLLKLYL